MIAYEILVQTIADWKAGVRPSAPIPPAAVVGAPESVEELASGVVDIDEGYAEEEPVGEDYGQGYQEYQDYDAGAVEEGGYEYEEPSPTETYDDDL